MTAHALFGLLIGLFTLVMVAVSAVTGAYNKHEDHHRLRSHEDCLFCRRLWRE